MSWLFPNPEMRARQTQAVARFALVMATIICLVIALTAGWPGLIVYLVLAVLFAVLCFASWSRPRVSFLASVALFAGVAVMHFRPDPAVATWMIVVAVLFGAYINIVALIYYRPTTTDSEERMR